MIPRIDTHCHLGGSLPTEFVWGIIQKQGLRFLAESHEDVVRAMTFARDEPRGFHRFLSKFTILDQIRWTEDLVDASTVVICDWLERQKIDYLWLDFSINKYLDAGIKWHRHEAIKFIYESFLMRRPNGVGLILSLKYESARASWRQYTQLIENADVANSVIGIDLVGDEELYDSTEWAALLKPWLTAGKMVRAHVGEFGDQENIRAAIQDIGVTNIAHGIKIEDPKLIAEAKERGIYFDLGLSSNYDTGVVTGPHPIRFMLDNGLKVTLGTDDPVICNTTLACEYGLALRNSVTFAECDQMRLNAVESTKRFASFSTFQSAPPTP